MDKVKIQDQAFRLEMPPVETGGCSVLMVGSTRSGKSYALKYILDKYFKKHCGAIFSQSAKADAYKDMNYPLLPKASCYIPELIHDAYKINMETNNHYPFLFIIDDCPTIRADKELMKMATIYRNSGVSSVTCGSWNYEKKIAWYRLATEDHHFIFIDNLAGTIARCKIDSD